MARVRPGQQVFVMVPESGRFVVSYMKLTAVRRRAARRRLEVVRDCRRSGRAAAAEPEAGNPTIDRLVRQLARVWIDFETQPAQRSDLSQSSRRGASRSTTTSCCC